MKILCKFPTRSRPHRFLQTLNGWIENATNPKEITFIVSYDHDDESMTSPILAATQGLACEVRLYRGNSKTKIEAVNANIGEMSGWDVLLVVSDDMFCRRKGWDDIIRQKMNEYFPDTDGALWFHDATKQKDICTLSCLGNKFYDRFGYVYHHSYASFFPDNEFTDVARGMEKLPFIDYVLASHEHPAWQGGMKMDELYQRNNKYWAQDQATYNRRKAAGFPR